MGKLTTLLFDVDGTLADTERDGHRVAFNRAFAEVGLDWEWGPELYGELLAVTGGKERIKFYLDRFNTAFPRPAAFDAFVADLHKAKTRHYTEMLAEGLIPLRCGVKRLIEEARAEGMRLGVVTTTTPANVEALLVHSLDPSAMGWFEVIAAGDIVPAKKPAPDIYLHAMGELGVSADQCIAFEDSRNGLRSSLGAGLKTIVAVNGYTREECFDGASLVLDQWGEPGDPCVILSGTPCASPCLDLAWVRRVHAGSAE